MFDIKIRFSLLGLIIFLLPMLINIVYFSMGKNKSVQGVQMPYKWVEMIEQVTRVLYAIVICFIVSNQKIEYNSPILLIGIIFLILYYVVWTRYFIEGMDESLLYKSFLFIPIPLAVFPVLYYICGALFLRNYIAEVVMIFFGIAHYTVSYFTLKRF